MLHSIQKDSIVPPFFRRSFLKAPVSMRYIPAYPFVGMPHGPTHLIYCILRYETLEPRYFMTGLIMRKTKMCHRQSEYPVSFYQEFCCDFSLFGKGYPMVWFVIQKTIIGKFISVFVIVEGSTPKPAAISFVFTGLVFPLRNLIYSTFFGESSRPSFLFMKIMSMFNPKNVCPHSKNFRARKFRRVCDGLHILSKEKIY